MEPTTSWLHPFWAFALPIALSFPLGRLLWRVLDVPEARAGRGLDAAPVFLARLTGRRDGPGGWRGYAVSMLTFNASLFVLTFALLYAQHRVGPLNPDGKGPLGALGYTDGAGVRHEGADTAVVFNTACSFVTNTNLQHYSGEQHLSYFGQLAGIVWLMFVTPAVGLCVMLATVRGLRGDRNLGHFYVDLMRSLVFVLLPLAGVLAVALVGLGVPMTFQGAAQAAAVDGPAAGLTTQVIARGPVAALVAVKQLGTNGGGFFGPNSAHPFENPSPWSNLVELAAIVLIPMATLVMAGFMLKNLRHALVLYGVMLALLAAGVVVAVRAETRPSAATGGLPVAGAGNLEGKEVRFGPTAAATWAAFTTATSNGSVNAMHDSLNPLAGLVALVGMMLNVAFSGIGAGFENMLMYVVIAVFIAGLMVGRTPEYLGKKVEAREVKLAMAAVLVHPLLICGGTALFAATAWGASTTANPGAHGFSEILYEFTSAAANNGSGFEGLGDNTPAWNVATGVVLLLGRFPALVLPLAVAGFLAAKKRVPQTSGTLRTDDLTFAGMLLGTVVLVGALSFLPALVLGPVAEQLSAQAGVR